MESLMLRYSLRSIVVAVALVLVSGLAASCSNSATVPAPTEFVYGLTIVPSGIDPHINASAELGIALRSVYDTLVYRDPKTGDFVPGLAESWEISGDGLTYTFVLRKDVKFHDGTPFNAEAVKVNIERILDPNNHSAKAAQLLGPVKTIQVHDAYTVSIILAEPFAPLMDGLSQPYVGMASPKALAANDASTYQFNQVGTGPYRFVEYVVNDRLVLERNKDYKWGPSVVTNPGVPAVDRVIFRFYTDAPSRALALESGDAQVMGEVIPTDAKRLSEGNKAHIDAVAVPGQPLQFLVNTSRKPTDNLAVRQALILATDRQAIVQAVFQGYSPIAYGPLSSSTLYFDPSIEGRYAYDPVQATALFNSSGITDTDGDGWRDDKGQLVELTVVVPPWGMTPDVVQLLKSQWESVLKVHVKIRQVASFPMLSDAAKAGEYNLIALNFFGYDPVVLNAFYQSDGSLNWSHLADSQLDQLLHGAQREMDPTRRKELYAKIQSRIMDDAAVIPIRDYVNLNGIAAGIQGLHFDAQGWFPYLTDIGFGQ